MTDHQPPVADQQVRFNELFRSHAPAVYRLALSALQDAERANDIVQEVFLAVWEQYERDFAGKPSSRSDALIMKIAKRRVIDVWRRTDGAVPIPEYVESAVPMLGLSMTSRNPLERVLNDDAFRHIRFVLSQNLTTAEYRVALMAWALWLPDTEIAKIIGSSVSTVHSHKSRARAKIRTLELGGDYLIDFEPGTSSTQQGTGKRTRNEGEVTA
ncbi:RNA polymerase sigma factor [Nocardia sp. CA-120079]|uniref:RNA polymerase sigma factor n=1 Tax=Nocardia sp. CA-120079 TaxID=3239974 RepID=UPI003D9795FD